MATQPLTRRAAAGVACLAAACPAWCDQVLVAVAANFAGPLARIAEGFGAATGHTLKISSGATGKFHAQIVAGAPFEVLALRPGDALYAQIKGVAPMQAGAGRPQHAHPELTP